MEVDSPDQLNVSVKSAASDEDMFAISQEIDTGSPDRTVISEGPCCSKETPSVSEPDSKGKHWRGTPLNKLLSNKKKAQYPPVAVGPKHSVFFKLPVKEGEIPKPWPEKSVDFWDQNHVRMPHSGSNLYPVTATELRKRWELVEESLRTTITTSHQLEAAILHYNSKYSDRWDFKALHTFFSEVLEEIESEYFFTKVLPKVIDLALSLPNLVTTGVPLLRQHTTHSISLTQQQISCLLANAFLCTFPRRNTSKKDSEYSSFPDINFNRLFSGLWAESKGRMDCLHEKLKCLINYFRRVTTKVPDGVITYSRHYIPPDKLPVWSEQKATLPNMYISSSGTIEDEGSGMMQMDFANRFVGGGVLGHGCVQEEIRFVICPELILARLFAEVLDDTEAIVITGCERFNTYRGYSNNFEWAGNVEDSTPRDCYGRRFCTVVAIDASKFPNAKTQYTAENINRELNKAYSGFSWGLEGETKESVATGNWGCGAFRGDACLKTLLQLMVAGVTGRGVAYFTFGDEELRDKLADMHGFLTQKQVTVGELWKIITTFNPVQYRHGLYDHIYMAVNTGSIPSPIKSFYGRPNSKVTGHMKQIFKTANPFASKKPRVQETSNESRPTNGHRLSENEIEKELSSGTDESIEKESSGVKPVEAKTLSVQNDKDLCLQRLSSSWTNLNDSKKDFSSKEPSRSVESSQTLSRSSSSEENHSMSRKKKISDYFQPVSKS